MKMKAGLIRTSWTGVPRRQTFQHQEINHTNWKDRYLSEPEAAEADEEEEKEEEEDEKEEFSGQKKAFFSHLLPKVRNWPWKVHTAAFSFQLWICENFFFSLLKPLQETL